MRKPKKKEDNTYEVERYNDKEHYPDYIEAIYEYEITPGFATVRIDKFLTQSIENATRTRVQKALDGGRIEVNGEVMLKSNYKIRNGDKIKCTILKAPPLQLRPENISLDIVYEDEHLLVVNKPAFMVVHPGLGNRYGTLVNGLLYHLGQRDPLEIRLDDGEDDGLEEQLIEAKLMASDKVRPGIVHRIDKDTSGLLVVAKAPDVLAKLQKQFADHTTERTYYALTWGRFKENDGVYDGEIGRHPNDRKAFWVTKKDAKTARTDYKVITQFEFGALLQLNLHTGRTHQIRVHCSHDKHPLIGDVLYGGNRIVYGNTIPEYRKAAQQILKLANRQMLHAKTLGFIHPVKNEFMQFDSPLPSDFRNMIEILKSVNVDRATLLKKLL
ncbi:MAG: RNA pseudouridine synthase [Bacteroidetes bacterium 4572_77]|nr:MAG: RNA pseudouridine synthase [Bacteroidetes bacterium 4572_77]